ncbi:SGNH/GDSL hydrolase family protein [Phyllobacterium sp. SB3]|uniref:SGNH/GDSL hydrolase family protein n=1 Tax=Phyllobacterium sp. SB3 TaxID=3156073 RepID=UPI0032AFB8A3
MKTVLAFGDSLTWGAIPASRGARHAYQDRWPSVLEAGLPNVRVICEGLMGRTTCFDDADATIDRNGSHILPILLATHAPLDLVIIMLGTNDLKPEICGNADGAAAGMRKLVHIIQTCPFGPGQTVPQILLVAPPRFANAMPANISPAGGRSIAESLRLSKLYRQVAKECSATFFDSDSCAIVSPIDGVHLDAVNTQAIGTALIPVVAGLVDC